MLEIRDLVVSYGAIEAVRGVASPGSTIRTAAITVTSPLPLAAPDLVLYRGWLCRFPWSLDA